MKLGGVDLTQQAMLLSRGMNGLNGGWFTPGQPLAPMAPENFGWYRALDYSLATNATITPKAVDVGLTYAQLRNLAESSDYVAMAIQTVLDRLCATEGRVVDVGGDPRKPSKKASEINDWAQAMDGVTSLPDFLQRAAYDMCVIDAPAAAVDKTAPGKPVVYNIDGASIVAHLNERGRVASLGQVIKGQIAHEYQCDEIIWMPKNRRPNKVYGFSFVEQIKNIVAISLSRTARQMDWFAQGNIPDVLFMAPDGWTPQQIKDINQNWEKQLAGINGRGKGRWMPPGTTVESLDRNPVVGEFDEWLIRVICYAFSLPPTAFVKQVNRSTSETMQDASVSEGHAAILRWASSFLTAIIASAWGSGYRWEWNLAQPTKDDTIKLLAAGILKPSAAVRLGYSLDEIADPPKPVAQIAPVAGKPEQIEVKPAAKEEEPKEAVANADAALTPEEQELADLVQRYLDRLNVDAQAVAEAQYQGKAVELPSAAPQGWRASAEVILKDAALAGASIAANMTPKKPETTAEVVAPAKAYAKQRSAEMVGMKVDKSGNLVPNPEAKWQVSEMARATVREKVSQAFEEHWPVRKLADEIASDRAFGALRANNIARTETAMAQEAGSMTYFKAAGVTGKRWSDHDGCPVCKANAAQGIIPIDQPFQSGHMHAPAHPGGCRCRILPEELPE